MECTGRHQGEEAAATRRKGEGSTNESKKRRRATAETGMGLRQRKGMERGGEGGGAAPRRRGGDSGDRTKRGRKEVRRSCGERSQLRSTPAARRPVTQAVVVGLIPTSSPRRAHLKTCIGAMELLQQVLEGPLKNTSTPGCRACFLRLKRGVQGGRVAGGGRGREPKGAVEEKHTRVYTAGTKCT